MVNSQPTQYMHLATGVGSIQAGNSINQNLMKLQQIQNSMPQNSFLLGQINRAKYSKAAARATNTVMMAEPQPKVSGNSPNMKDDHMDKKVEYADDDDDDYDYDDDDRDYAQEELDHHANQCNPNSDEYQDAMDNHANQMNPNNDAYQGRRWKINSKTDTSAWIWRQF